MAADSYLGDEPIRTNRNVSAAGDSAGAAARTRIAMSFSTYDAGDLWRWGGRTNEDGTPRQ